MASHESDLNVHDIFINDNGDIFVKVDDAYCAYIGNITKSKTDKSLLLPTMPDMKITAVLGSAESIIKPVSVISRESTYGVKNSVH